MPEWPYRRLPTPERALGDIESPREEARLDAIEALADAAPSLPEGAREALRRALSDRSAKVRAAAALALAELGAEGALSELEALLDDADGRVRQAAVVALGESGEPSVLPVVQRALESDEADLRFQAVLAAARLAPERALELLAPLLDDEDAEVRANVAAALSDVGGGEALAALTSLLTDPALPVRLEAAIALGRAGDERASPVLVEALDDRDYAPQAVLVLGTARVAEAADKLEELCHRFFAGAPLRAAAAAALTAIDEARGWPELEQWLGGRRRDARAMAVYHAGELQLRRAVPVLIELLDDPKNPDRDAAARALGLVGDARAERALRSATSDDDEDVATEARAALERLAERTS